MRWYCFEDCRLTKEIAEHWLTTFQRQFGFLLRNWISSGFCAEKVLINNGIIPPYFNELPYHVQELAWRAYCGGRFELLVGGYVGSCWLYNINSAYPFALTKLPDITNGKWISGSNRINPNAVLGFFNVRASIHNSVRIALLPFRTKNKMLIYPVGEFETHVTLEELKAVEDDGRIRYEIPDSQQFIPNKGCSYPYKAFIERQYYRRLELKAKKDPLEQAIKIVLNSIYGKMAQRIGDRMGSIFNPVIVAFITGFARAQLYTFMRRYNLERDIVAFATDSIAVKKEIAELDSRMLGEMKRNNRAHDVIYLYGFYRFKGKWKQRGVGYYREKKIDVQHMDTWIDERGQLWIKLEATGTTHIRSGILYDMIRSVGKIEPYRKKIRLNSDRKRNWIGEIQSLLDMKSYGSSPYNINMIAKIVASQEASLTGMMN